LRIWPLFPQSGVVIRHSRRFEGSQAVDQKGNGTESARATLAATGGDLFHRGDSPYVLLEIARKSLLA